MPRKGPLSQKAYFAMKAKLKREGKWDESRANKWKPPPSSDTEEYDPDLDITEPEIERLAPAINNAVDQAGKLYFMSKNAEQLGDVSLRSSTTASISETGIIYKSDKINTEINMETKINGPREVPGGDLSILHEGGHVSKQIRETNKPYQSNSAERGAIERPGITGISSTEGDIRDSILIFDRKLTHPVYFKDFKKGKNWGDPKFWESYFQSYNSIGIVIKSLPDDSITSYDVYLELCKFINDPFVLISEKSKEGVLHWHMIWLTSKRSDNAKRSLENYLKGISTRLSIACQQTRSLKHLLKYILKDPISVGVAYSDTFAQMVYGLLDTAPYVAPEIQTASNPLVKDLMDIMQKHNVYSSEELYKVAPDTMLKYLHKPNLENIINNCKLFLLRPSDARTVFKRAVHGWTGGNFVRIWNWLLYQDINPGDFILDLWNILFRSTDKHNVLCLQGPSNAGKTTFIRPLLEMINFGEIVSGGQFMFQGCINKDLLIWEEPLIGPDYVEMCKRVFEGMTTQIPVKFKAPQTLYRTPILITTNKDIWHYCSADSVALQNRMLIYYALNDITNCHRDAIHERETNYSYNQWLADLSEYVAECKPFPSTRTEPGEPASSGSSSSNSKQLRPEHECSCAVCSNSSKQRERCISR